PPFSYASLIAQAILASPSRQLTLRDIYQWLMDRYPSLYRVDDSSWQNTIRHNLSLNKCFCKAPRQPEDANSPSNKGKGGYWCVN
ncbi:fork head domain-containing protein, partial [Syncephalis pseudoplumigaleata]